MDRLADPRPRRTGWSAAPARLRSAWRRADTSRRRIDRSTRGVPPASRDGSGPRLSVASVHSHFLWRSGIRAPVAERRPGSRRDLDKPHDAAHDVPVLMRPLKPRVIVELRIRGQANCLPMGQQRRHRRRGGEDRPRPRAQQAAMQRDTVEDFDLQTSLDDQAFHEIEAIQFGPTRCHVGQVPAGRGAGRRIRRCASRIPRRSRMRSMVRIARLAGSPRSTRAR